MKKRSLFSYPKPEHSPGYLLWKVTTAWQRLLKKVFEPYNISHSQFVIMAVTTWLIEHKEQATQVAIASLSGLDKMTISQALKKLIALKLITRKECRSDTRAKVVTLTPRGKDVVKNLIPLVEKTDEVFFDALSKEEYKSLITIFNILNQEETL